MYTLNPGLISLNTNALKEKLSTIHVIHAMALEFVIDLCDPQTALNILCVNKHMLSVLSYKRDKLKRKCRFEWAQRRLVTHVSDLPSRILSRRDNNTYFTDYTVGNRSYMINVDTTYVDNEYIESITSLSGIYRIIKNGLHENFYLVNARRLTSYYDDITVVDSWDWMAVYITPEVFSKLQRKSKVNLKKIVVTMCIVSIFILNKLRRYQSH
jgi:hypothetical protein